MFPLRDHNPSDRTPYVTWALMLANILIFISYFGMFSDERALSLFFRTWGIIPAEITSGGGYGTLVSSIFLHGGLMHIAGNMLFLWIFGDNLEDAFGHLGFLVFYLLSGIAAGWVQVVAAPNSVVPVIGASGAIAGVMGGYLLLYPRARIDILIILIFIFKIVPVPAWVMLGIWFGLQVFSGTTVPTGGGGVAYWAHAGGFIAGLVLCLPMWLRRGGTASWGANHGHPPHPDAQYVMTRSGIPRVSRTRKRGPWG